MSADAHQNHTRGTAAEYEVASKLASAGFNVAMADSFAPWDIVADWRGKVSRLQVKACASPAHSHTVSYRIPLTSRKKKYTTDDFDFFIAVLPWAKYVIPAERVVEKNSLLFWERGQGPKDLKKKPCQFEEYREAWETLQ